MVQTRGSGGRSGGRRRWVLRIAVGVVVLVGLAAVLAPAVVGPIVRGQVERGVSGAIAGRVEVGRVSLSWLGSQRVEGVRLLDPDGGEVAFVDVRLGRSLLGLATNWRDLGTLTVGGRASVVRGADGTTNVERAGAPATPRPTEPATEPLTLPMGLKGAIALDGLSVVYSDSALAEQTGGRIGAVAVRDLRGGASVEIGGPWMAEIDGRTATGATAADLADSGVVKVAGRLEGVTDSAGAFDVAGAVGSLAWEMSGPGVSTEGEIALDAGVMRTVRAIALSADLHELAAIVPALGEAFSPQESVEFGRLPTVRVEATVDGLAAPLDGGDFDLRSASAVVELAIGAVEGTVLVPASPRRPFAVEPFELRVDATDPATGVSVTGGTRATIDGASAGTVAVSMMAGGVLDERGAVRAGVPERLEGSVELTGFATPVLQPLAELAEAMLPVGASIDLAADIGPVVDFVVRADAEPSADGGAHAASLTATLRSSRVEMDASLAYDGERVSTRGDGVRIVARSLAPLLDRMLAGQGVNVVEGARVEVRVPSASVRVASLLAADGPDLRGASFTVDVAAGETVARLPLVAGGPQRRVDIAPLALRVQADDADAPAVDLRVSASVQGVPAGVLEASVRAGGVLDGGGRPGMPRTIDGRVSLRDASTTLVRAFVGDALAEAGIQVEEDIGPTVSIVAAASTVFTDGVPAVDLDLTVRSRHLDVAAPVRWAEGTLSTRDESVVASYRRPGALAGQLLPPGTGVRIGAGGWVRAVVSSLSVLLDAETMMPLVHRTRADVTVTAGEMSATYDPLPPGVTPRVQPVPLGLGELRAVASVTPGAAPRVEVDATLSHRDKAFTARARGTAHGLIREPEGGASPLDAIDAAGVRPEGTLTLTGVPVGLVEVLPPELRRLGERNADTLTIARELLGETIDVRATVKPAGEAFGFEAQVTYADGSAAVAGTYAPDALGVERATVSAKVKPRAADLLLGAFAPDPGAMPRLADTADVRVSVGAFTLGLTPEGGPDWARSRGSAPVEFVGALPMRDVVIPRGEGEPPMRLDYLTLSAINAKASVPVEAMGDAQRTATAEVSLRGFARGTGHLFDASAKASAPVRGGEIAGAPEVTATLDELYVRWVEDTLGWEGLISGATGARVKLDVTAVMPSLAAGAPGGADRFTAAVASPRLNTVSPVGVALHADRVELTGPAEVRWTMEPEWGNRWVFPPPADGTAPGLAFAEGAPVSLRVERLAVALGEGVGPLRAPVFDVQVEARVPSVSLVTADGTALRVGDVSLGVRRGSSPQELAFTLGAPRWTVGSRAEVRPAKSQISGTVTRYADAAGNPAFENAVMNADVAVEPVPTELIDGLASQGGLLVDALGEMVNVSATARDLSMRGGTLQATAATPNATATVRGRMSDGGFIADESSGAVVSRVTPALTNRLRAAIPIVARFEKTERDEPMRLVMNSPVVVPIDGTFDALNGDMTLDLGTATFAMSDMFSRVLRVVQQRHAGEVGRRMPAIAFHMRDGLVRFDRYALPVGEYTVYTEGVINLSSRRVKIRSGSDRDAKNWLEPGHLEVITVAPAGAVAFDALDVLGTGLLNLPGRIVPGLNTLTNVPFRTRGPIADPKTDLATDLIGNQLIDNIARPGRLFEGIGSGLR